MIDQPLINRLAGSSRRRAARLWPRLLAALALAVIGGQARSSRASGDLSYGFYNGNPLTNLNLSACGALDWVLWQSPMVESLTHLGVDTPPVAIRKAGPRWISDLSFVGVRDPGTSEEYWASSKGVTSVSWTDAESGAGQSEFGVVIGSESGFGVSFSVLAIQETLQMDVYFECRGSPATYTVQASNALEPKMACSASPSGLQRLRILWWENTNPLVVTLTGSTRVSGTGIALFGVTLTRLPFPNGTPPLLTSGCDPTKASGAGGAGTGGTATGAAGAAGGRSGSSGGSAVGGGRTGGVAMGGSAGEAFTGGRAMGGSAGGAPPADPPAGDTPNRGPGRALSCALGEQGDTPSHEEDGLVAAALVIPWLRRRRRARTW